MELEGHLTQLGHYFIQVRIRGQDTAAPAPATITATAAAIAAAAALTTDIFLLMRCCGLKEISKSCKEYDDKGFFRNLEPGNWHLPPENFCHAASLTDCANQCTMMLV